MSGTETSFFVTGGTLGHDAPSYVERGADHELFAALLKGEFCYVLTSRQMGKSSLMVRTARKLRKRQVEVIALDLTAVGRNLTPDQWYDGLMVRIGQQLGLEDEFELFWKNHAGLSPVQRLFTAIEQLVLSRHARPLVIFVDEIDIVRSLPFVSDEFFAAIRECHNRRAEDGQFKRLTFCLLGVALPSDLIRDTRTTPFNIGRRIELNDFTEEEARPLAAGLQGEGASTRELLRRVLHWTNGHPYLTQRLCRALAERPCPSLGELDRVCADLYFSSRAREQDDNLVFVRERLLRSELDVAGLLSFYGQVRSWSRRVADDETNPMVSALRLSGVIRSEHGRLVVRNRIYARAFDRNWIRIHMPDAARERERKAFVRGVTLAAAGAIAILGVLAGLLAFAWEKHRRAEESTWKALRAQAQSSRLTTHAGRRFEALEALRQAAAIKRSQELTDEAIASLSLVDLKPGRTWRGYPPGTTAIAFSPGLEFYARSDPEGGITVRKVSSDAEQKSFRVGVRGAEHLWFSADGASLAASMPNVTNSVVSVWRWSSGQRLVQFTNGLPPALDFSSDGALVAFAGEGGSIEVFDLERGEWRGRFEAGMECSSLRFRPGTEEVAVASQQRLIVELFQASSGTKVKTLYSPSQVLRLAWHPRGQWLAAACQDRRVRLWDVTAERSVEELDRQSAPITGLTFNQAGTLLASSGEDGSLRLWDPFRGKLLALSSSANPARDLQFSIDDRQLASQIVADQVQLWVVASGSECQTLFDPGAEVINQIGIHPGGRLLASAHNNGVSLWDLALGRKLTQMSVGWTAGTLFQPGTGNLVNNEFGGIHQFTLAPTTNNSAGDWLLKAIPGFHLEPGVSSFSFGAGGAILAVARGTNVQLIDTRGREHSAASSPGSADILSGHQVQVLTGPGTLDAVAMSSKGEWVAAASQETQKILIWNTNSPQPTAQLPFLGPAELSFSPDGHWLTAGTAKECVLWQTGGWRLTKRMPRLESVSRPTALTFSVDGRLWAWPVSDTVVRLGETKGWITLGHLEGPDREPLVSLRFTPDGSRLACATESKFVSVWNLSLLERGLNDLQLGWGAAVFAGQQDLRADPLRVTVDLGSFPLSVEREELKKARRLEELSSALQRGSAPNYRWRQRADLYKKLGRFAEAIEDQQEYVRREPNDPKGQTELAWLYLFGSPDVRSYDRAMAAASMAVRLDEGNAAGHGWLGVACYRIQQYEQALTHLQRARELDGTRHKALLLYYLAMCQAKRGELDQARLHYQAATAAEAELKGAIAPSPANERQGLAAEATKELER